MAKAEILTPFIQSYEGGFANNPKDPGGATNKGVTLSTYRNFYGQGKTIEDLKKMTDAEWNHIFKTGFWDKMRADEIKSQSVANLLVDWAYGSGSITPIKKLQEVLGIEVDGKLGPKTIEAINSKDPEKLFNDLWKTREQHFKNNKLYPTFGKGWMKRLNSIGFESLTYHNSNEIKQFKD